MRLILAVAMLLVLPGAAVAGCAHDPSVRGRVHCLRALVETGRAALEGEIATLTADIAASGRVLRGFTAALTVEQARWRRAADDRCRTAGDAEAVEKCRLVATKKRRAQVRAELDRARERLGLAPVIRVPQEVEILVPLPHPPAGPDADVQVPLQVPISGD